MMAADYRDRQVGESYKDYAARMAGVARAAERDRDAAMARADRLLARVDALEAVERHARDFAESDPADGLRAEWQAGFRYALADTDKLTAAPDHE